jgi:hypothetical protein
MSKTPKKARTIKVDWRFAEQPKPKRPTTSAVEEWFPELNGSLVTFHDSYSGEGMIRSKAHPAQPGSHLDGNPLQSLFGDGEHCEQVPHLSDAIQTIGHVLGRGFYANQRGREGLLIQHLTLKHLAPRSTESGVDRDAWYRAIYQGIVALARTPHYEHWAPTDPNKNPWRLPKSVAARIKPLEGQDEYGTWRTPLSKRQRTLPLAHYRTWEDATVVDDCMSMMGTRSGSLRPRPTKTQWKEELALRKRIARRNWAEDQKYLLPCAWDKGRRLAAQDEKQKQEQFDRQRKQDLVDRTAPKKVGRKTVKLYNRDV